MPPLLAYTQSLGRAAHLTRPTRGIPTLALALVWLALAWLGSGRPFHRAHLVDPLLAAPLGRSRLPCAMTLSRGLTRFPAKAVRAAVEAAYQAELPRRVGRVWAARDAHQVPCWGRGQTGRFHKGWSGSHGRSPRGYRRFLAVDTDTGQVVTFLLARGRPRDARVVALLARRVRQIPGRRLAGVVADRGFTSRAALAALVRTRVPFILGFARSKPITALLDGRSGQQRRWLRDAGAVDLGACHRDTRLRLIALGARTPTDQRGPWVDGTSPWATGPTALARLSRQRWRVEQAIDELLHGRALDHLVGYRPHPNRVAIGLRLLARNLAIGYQIHAVGRRPERLREPRAFRATAIEGLGQYVIVDGLVILTPIRPSMVQECHLPWTHQTLRYAV